MSNVIEFPKRAQPVVKDGFAQPAQMVVDEQSRGAAAALLDIAANPDQLKAGGPAGLMIASVFGAS